jgi:hypothetical protein
MAEPERGFPGMYLPVEGKRLRVDSIIKSHA